MINLDRWVSHFLRRGGYEYEIDFGERTANLWKQAVDMAPDDLNLARVFADHGEEIDYIAQYLREVRQEEGSLEGVCVVARTNNLLRRKDSPPPMQIAELSN